MRYLAGVLAFLCLLSTYLSYSFYGSKIKAEGDLRVAQASLLSLQESYDKQAKACLISERLSLELQDEVRAKQEESKELLDKIDRLPTVSKSQKGTEESQNGNVKNEEIDIDSRLPESIRMLTEQAYRNLQGQTDADAR